MIPLEPILDHYGVDYRDKQGNQQILCPFHDDTRASGSVSLSEGLFNCFTCSASGDAIEFIMLKEGVDFVSAKRIAEGMAGETGDSLQRSAGRADTFLPRKSGHRPGRRQWVSPWASKRSGPNA
jgi:DNA primase